MDRGNSKLLSTAAAVIKTAARGNWQRGAKRGKEGQPDPVFPVFRPRISQKHPIPPLTDVPDPAHSNDHVNPVEGNDERFVLIGVVSQRQSVPVREGHTQAVSRNDNCVSHGLAQQPEQLVRSARRSVLNDLPVFGRDGVEVLPLHRNPALRSEVNLRLVLAETHLFYL